MSKLRIAVGAITLSAAAFVGITTREGFSGQAYPDPVHGTALPTYGFGSTEGVKMGDTITVTGALQRTLREVGAFERGVRGCLKADLHLHQHEYDAFIELAHNIGARNFCEYKGRPTQLVQHLNADRYAEACDAILQFKYAGGFDCSTPGNRVCSGLWKDRLRVYAKCKGAS